jgi:hypothetical protein
VVWDVLLAAVIHHQPAIGRLDQLISQISRKKIHASYGRFGYIKRVLIETQITRIKRHIGAVAHALP